MRGYLDFMRGRLSEDNRAIEPTFVGGAGESFVSASKLSAACCIAERCLLCWWLGTLVSARRRQGARTLFDYLWQECGAGNTIPHAAGLTRGDCNIVLTPSDTASFGCAEILQSAAAVSTRKTGLGLTKKRRSQELFEKPGGACRRLDENESPECAALRFRLYLFDAWLFKLIARINLMDLDLKGLCSSSFTIISLFCVGISFV